MWKPCIPIDGYFYPEQNILLQKLLKITILQVTGGFVFQVTRGSKLVINDVYNTRYLRNRFFDTLCNFFISINQYQSKHSFLIDVMEDYSRI